jgi:hypothetical protein
VLRLFVRREIFEEHEARAMLAWPHSGFHVHDGVLVPEDDTRFALRLARYCARNPVAVERLAYEGKGQRVRYRSDKLEGPTAGTETVDPLEFLARLVTHIPDKHHVMTRYYGWYATRPRGTRRKLKDQAATQDLPGPMAAPMAEREVLPLTEARRRWADLLRRIYEVDPLTSPHCRGPMRITAFITEQVVIDRILDHLRRAREHSRGPPRARSPAVAGPALGLA